MTLEYLGTSQGTSPYTMPADVAEAARKHLRGVMPDLKVTEVARQPRQWRMAAQVKITEAWSPLKTHIIPSC